MRLRELHGAQKQQQSPANLPRALQARIQKANRAPNSILRAGSATVGWPNVVDNTWFT